MGLDLRLARKRFINADEAKAKGLDVGGEGGVYVETTVAVWRKANAIYRYLAYVAEAEYDDVLIYLNREMLEGLLDTCKRLKQEVHLVKGKVCDGYHWVDGEKKKKMVDGLVVDNPKLCEDLLPTQDGFFFGSTDYDEDYMGHITYTIERLEDALKQPDGVLDEWVLYPSW